ncbi:MAG: hypothetical protein ACP5PV_01385 [Methanothrix sp.]
MAYLDNERRIGRRGRAAKRLLDCYEKSMQRSERAIRYAKADYDKPAEEGS